MPDAAIQFEGVSRHFGDVRAVDAVDLEVQDGEFFSMLGPSGSGKTTCLRMIAGFDRPTSGRIVLYGQDVSSLPPYERPVNTVFQDYALFPHMTVGAKHRLWADDQEGSRMRNAKRRVDEMLELVQLPGFGASEALTAFRRPAAARRAGARPDQPSHASCFWTSPWAPWI